jgi:hypothetical protein
LADHLAKAIGDTHAVFIDTQIPLGKLWGDVIQEHLAGADFLIALVSEGSANSPMVVAEIEEAHRLNVAHGRPEIIPIRINYDRQLRYPLSAYVNRFQQAAWRAVDDTDQLTRRVLEAIGGFPGKPRPASQRLQMIARVRADWIEGVLEKSLYNVARIDLGLRTQPGAVERGVDALIQRPEITPRALAPGTRVLTVFDEQLGQLLILGAPGAGKTTLLLELTCDLLERAARDQGHRIPVVFNLSSWAQNSKPLLQWMADELRLRSDVPRKTAEEWVQNDQILPLFDGLDEVIAKRRQKCVEAINDFRSERGFTPVVVCSRTAEYESLVTKLRLPGAVVVQNLSREQVGDYLAAAGQKLRAVCEALDIDETLWDLLTTPLMLSIVALAYADREAGSIDVTAGSRVERQQQIFAAYINQMFRRRTKETRYSEAQIRKYLSWIGSRMVAAGQTRFQIEDVRSRWTGRRSLLGLSLFLVVLIVTLLSGMMGWFNNGLFEYTVNSNTSILEAFSLANSFHLHLYFVLFIAPIGAVLALLRAPFASTAEILQLQWPGLNKVLLAILKWGGLGGALGSVLGTVGCAAVESGFYRTSALAAVKLFGPACATAFGIAGAATSMITARPTGVRYSPTLALTNSMRSALLCSLGALALSLPFILIWRKTGYEGNDMFPPWVLSIVMGCCYIGWVGLFIALERGGYFLLDHFVTRWLLTRKKLIPKNLVGMLDTAAERVFLRKVGGGYIFVHRTMLEYFASHFCEAKGATALDPLKKVP